MPTIEQRRTPVKVSGGLAYHYSWVKIDDEGNEESLDGWPTNPDGTPYIEGTGFGRPLKALQDAKMKGEEETVGRYSGTEKEIKRRWDAAQAAVKAINAKPPSYQPMDSVDFDTKDTVPATNSNSVHATIGKAMGFDTSDQVGGHAPGMNRQVLPDDFTPPGEKLPPATLTGPDGPKTGTTPGEQNATTEPQAGATTGPTGAPPSGKQQKNGTDASDLLQGGEGNDTLAGGGANDEVPEPAPQPTGPSEQNKSDTPADPRAASLVQMASAPVTDPGRAAALKPVEKLTEAEMKDMIGTAQTGFRGWRSGDPLKAHLYEKVQDWHVNVYGDAPQQYDGGKPVEPKPIRAIAQEPSPHATPQGEDLWQATGRLGQKVADAGATDGFGDAVKALQRGLNMLNQAQPLPPRSPAYGSYTKLGPVTEDGKYGPQTDFALKQATARLGAPKVEEAFALGRFNTFARNAQRNGAADGLEARTHAIFGPLFRGPDAKAPKVEGGVLQETLNSIGPRHHDDWEPLKVDNWIGPKTTDAFGRVLKAEDPDEVTTAFGRGLGLL